MGSLIDGAPHMKKILLATIAFSMIATPAAFAQPYKPFPQKEYQRDNRDGRGYDKGRKHHDVRKKQRWSKGQRFDRDYRRYRVDERDYRRYRLHNPPRGYHWVRVDNDFILVAAATGIISSVIGAAIANSR
jgi:Ni/Co efflux regulator RcnB